MKGPKPHRRRRAFCITLETVDTRQLEKIRSEIVETLLGRQLGKIFQLSERSIAIDFHPHAGQYLFINLEPHRESIYLIRRRLKLIERQSINKSAFASVLKGRLTHSALISTEILKNGAGIVFSFQHNSAELSSGSFQLAAQIPRKNANVFLLDNDGTILARQREFPGDVNQVGEQYQLPETVENPPTEVAPNVAESLSDLLDEAYRSSEAEDGFNSTAVSVQRSISNEIKKKQKLIANLESDLRAHGDPEKWKQYGDLILANIATLRRENGRIYLTDLFDEDMPEISFDVDEHRSLNEIASDNFRRYAKARNAKKVVAERLIVVNAELDKLSKRLDRLAAVIESKDEDGLMEFLPQKRVARPNAKKKIVVDEIGKFARKFSSSDNFQILVGKKARDNDHLTFRIARSFDTWMHAADFPGSHVVIQNPSKKAIPDRTLIEAAQLAAFYSDARELGKAAVNYTLRKFVNKPKRANPGAVSLASFKTILVKPGVPIEKAV